MAKNLKFQNDDKEKCNIGQSTASCQMVHQFKWN